MDEHEWLTERFEEHRTRLHAVAHRMLGSLSETDDAVQEAWLRLSRLDTASRCASSGLDGPSRRGESGGARTTPAIRRAPPPGTRRYARRQLLRRAIGGPIRGCCGATWGWAPLLPKTRRRVGRLRRRGRGRCEVGLGRGVPPVPARATGLPPATARVTPVPCRPAWCHVVQDVADER